MSNKFLDIAFKKKYTGLNIQSDWDDYMRSLNVVREKRPIRIMVYVAILNVLGYRAFYPLMELAKNPHFDIRMANIISSNEDTEWADIIFFPRNVGTIVTGEARKARAMGKKVVLDTDDFMHGLPDYHPKKRVVENSRYLQDADNLAGLANLMTVSTEYLKGLYAKRYPGLKIEVLPNCLRLEDCDRGLTFGRERKDVMIGWAGSNTHHEDLKLVTPALIELFKEWDNLTLLTFNYRGIEKEPYADAFEGLPLERRIHIGGTEPHLIYLAMSLIDVGLAPLIDNDFNRAKSNCKFLEYAISMIPMVATDLEPYHNDRGECILVKNNPSEWYQAIKFMLTNHEVTRSIRDIAYSKALIMYDIKKNIGKWERVFEGLYGG